MRLLCKNPDCQNARNGVMTPVPVPSQPETEPWPAQWKAYIARVLCGTVALYIPGDLETSKTIRPSVFNSADVSIMFDCLESQCGTLVQFHLRLPGGFDTPTLRDLLRAGFFHGECDHGHSYRTNGKEQIFRHGTITI
jgi:hypothetical protein